MAAVCPGVIVARKRLVTAGFEDGRESWIERQVPVREEKGRRVPNEPSRTPRFYESKLRRKAIRIARGRERLLRQNCRSSVMSVSQLILRTKTSHHYIRPKLSNHPNHVGKNLVVIPDPQGLLCRLGKSEIDCSREKLL